MHAVIRRYEGVDESRIDELRDSLRDRFLPRVREISGLEAYYFVNAGTGTIATIGIFESPEAAEESTQLARDFIRDEGLSDLLPNPPEITSGDVLGQTSRSAMSA
jgi:hypothetical protein